MHRLLSVLVISCLLGLPTAHGAQPTVPEVAGTTLITASKSGFIDVVFPTAARVSHRVFRNPDIDFRGGGRVVGVVLVRSGPPRAKAFELDLTRWSFCGKAGCAARRPAEFSSATNWEQWQRTKHDWVIPSGRYRMYVITDGADVSLQIDFEGLSGRTRLSPRHAASIGVRKPDHRTPSGQKNVVLAEDTFELTSYGLVVQATAESPQFGLGLDTACFRRRDVDPEDVEPKCGVASSSDTDPQGFDVIWEDYTWRLLGSGVWDSSFTYTHAGQTKGIDFITLYVSFD